MARYLDPQLARAKGLHFLLRYFNGESLTQIAASIGSRRPTVERYMKKALDGLIDTAQEDILKEVFPLVKELVKADLEYELKLAKKEGKKPNLATAERILKGMFIIDSRPTEERLSAHALPPSPAQGELPPAEPDSLEAVFVRAKRLPAKRDAPMRVIDVHPEEAPHPGTTEPSEHLHESGEQDGPADSRADGDERAGVQGEGAE